MARGVLTGYSALCFLGCDGCLSCEMCFPSGDIPSAPKPAFERELFSAVSFDKAVEWDAEGRL